MQIQCQGHGTKLFAAWPTVNFHFDKPCCIVLSLFAFALSLPTSPFCVLEPSSCAAPHQRGLVSPLMFQSLCLVYLCHLSPYCCPRPHLFGRLSAVHFMTAHTVNPVFQQNKSTALPVTLWTCCQCPAPPSSYPWTWIDWPGGLLLCVCVCMCNKMVLSTVTHSAYGLRIDSWCHSCISDMQSERMHSNPEHVFFVLFWTC